MSDGLIRNVAETIYVLLVSMTGTFYLKHISRLLCNFFKYVDNGVTGELHI